MPFDPYVKVEDIAVLVIDRNHPRFGQLGRLTFHDWQEYGIYSVAFQDGSVDVPDGLCAGDPPSPVKIFYRFGDEVGRTFDAKKAGLEELKRLHQELGIGTLESLAEKYESAFHQPMP
jgi:hypothetical protein